MGRLWEAKSSSSSAPRVVVSKLCVRDKNKKRTFTLKEEETKVVTSIQDVVEDPDVDIVVEVMGGTTTAKEVVRESLARGKSVVTANKALLAEDLKDWNDLLLKAQTDNNNSVALAYEASVCGGIPILHTLQTCFAGDVIHEIVVRRERRVCAKDT